MINTTGFPIFGLPRSMVRDYAAKAYGIDVVAVRDQMRKLAELAETMQNRPPIIKPPLWQTAAAVRAENRAAVAEAESESFPSTGSSYSYVPGGDHKAEISGVCCLLGQVIDFGDLRGGNEPRYSMYSVDGDYDFYADATLQDSHNDATANILGEHVSFTVLRDEILFLSRKIPRNDATDEILDFVRGYGSRRFTCSSSAKVEESHVEYMDVFFGRQAVQVVDAATFRHVVLCAPWTTDSLGQSRARAQNTSATFAFL